MRPSDEYDEVAERIVFDDPKSRAAIESGNDGELALCIAAVLRSHFEPGEHPQESQPTLPDLRVVR